MTKDNKPPKEIVDAWTKVCSYIRDQRAKREISTLFFGIEYGTKERLVRNRGRLAAPEYEVYNSYTLKTLDEDFKIESRPLKDKSLSSRL
ncbi:hypothetical protein JCM16358_22900 [Halanaerocella petrolearia]